MMKFDRFGPGRILQVDLDTFKQLTTHFIAFPPKTRFCYMLCKVIIPVFYF